MPSDMKYNGNIISTTDEIERILQQIRVILGTKQGEVLGDPNFGCDLEDYVFTYGLKKDAILTAITSQISRYLYYDHEKYNIEFDLNYGKDHESRSDYAVLDIIINNIKTQGILIS